MKELSHEASCPACGARITVYAEETGLLPDEFHGERRATHTWLVCDLRQRLNALQAKCESS
jgi:hypothetical protein